MVFVTRLVQPASAGGGLEAASVQITPRSPITVYYTNQNLEYKKEFLIAQTTISVLKNSIFGSTGGMSNPTENVSVLVTLGTATSGNSAGSFALAQGDGSVTIS